MGDAADPVVIVGGGPAGAALAYVLASQGVRVTLLERHHDFGREFRGELIQPSGLSCLSQMGLRDKVLALPHAAMTQSNVYRDRVYRFPMPLEAPGEDGPFFLPQTPVLELLVAEAAQFPGFELIRGAAVKDLIWSGERVVGVSATVDGAPRTFPARFVIASDGRYSIVRKRAGLDLNRYPSPEPEYDIAWSRIPTPEVMKGEGRARLYLGRGQLALFLPTPGDELQLGWILKKGAFPEIKELGNASFVRELAKLVTEDVMTSVRAHQDSLELTLLNVIAFCLKGWTKPGLLLLGDAAHTSSPAGGQGLNMALRDAVVAANHLAPALLAGGVGAQLDAAASAVQDERLPEILKIQRLQAQVPLLLYQETWWSRAIVGQIAPAFAKLAPRFFADSFRRTNQPFLSGVADVRLTPALSAPRAIAA
jgi:2-polyprenyl-6-methoxyphenol hydroxylase-like FAD-dependent oxidoreductase